MIDQLGRSQSSRWEPDDPPLWFEPPPPPPPSSRPPLVVDRAGAGAAVDPAGGEGGLDAGAAGDAVAVGGDALVEGMLGIVTVLVPRADAAGRGWRARRIGCARWALPVAGASPEATARGSEANPMRCPAIWLAVHASVAVTAIPRRAASPHSTVRLRIVTGR